LRAFFFFLSRKKEEKREKIYQFDFRKFLSYENFKISNTPLNQIFKNNLHHVPLKFTSKTFYKKIQKNY